MDARATAEPAREPVEVALHDGALLHRLVEDVATARVDVELHDLSERGERAMELLRGGERHARVAVCLLYTSDAADE